MLFFIALETLSLVTKHWRLRHPIQWWAFRFLKLNFYSCEGAYKKCVRLFDTLGSFFGLAGLLLGLFSLLCDQVGQHIPSVPCTIVAKAHIYFALFHPGFIFFFSRLLPLFSQILLYCNPISLIISPLSVRSGV